MADPLYSFPTFDKLEIVKSGIFTTSALSGGGGAGIYQFATVTDSITHNLGFIPIVMIYILFDSGYYPLPYTESLSSAGIAAQWFTIDVDTTNTTLSIVQKLTMFNIASVGQAFTLKYFLLRDKADN